MSSFVMSLSGIQERLDGKTTFTDYVNMISNELRRTGVAEHEINQIINIKKSALGKRISFFDAIQYWHRAIELTKNPLFALSAGANVHPADFGPLGLITTFCKTVGEAWRLAYRYQHIVSDGMNSHLITKGDTTINRTDCMSIDPEWARPYVEHDFIALLMIAKYGTANLIQDTKFVIHFRHKPAAPVEEYQKVFDAEYHFNQQHNQVIFTSEVLDTPIYSHNIEIYSVLSEKIMSLVRLSGKRDNLSVRVKSYIEDEVLMGRAVSLKTCSDSLNISQSTLKRKLGVENTNFLDLKNEVLIKIAIRMLSDHDIPMSKISKALGYSNLSSLTRFIKQHTGKAPSEFRT